MSESMSPIRRPLLASASARFAATVDLPTPPLPLATAITCLMPGNDNFWAGPPWACIDYSRCGSVWFNRLLPATEGTQVFQRVDAAVVTVVPGYLVGVVAD